jgi:type III pantothenate kinase
MEDLKYVVVDAGNSTIKWAEYVSGRTEAVRTSNSWNTELMDVCRSAQERCLISSVRDIPNDFLVELQDSGSLFLTHRLPLPIGVNYDTPETLGVDRIASAAAAHHRFPGENILIIDAGTCITADLLTADGVFQGGLIAPGINMRIKAMHQFTDHLPEVQPTTSITYPGKSTKESLIVGSVNSAVAEMVTLIQQLKSQYGDIRVVVTGGDLSYFDKHLKNEIFASPNLVLDGLYQILKINVQFD